MTPRPTLSAAQARLLHLAAQGLLAPPARTARPRDVLATVRRMALLQLDTIHVVARSHHLVLHARLGDYRPEWLDELLAGGGALRDLGPRGLPGAGRGLRAAPARAGDEPALGRPPGPAAAAERGRRHGGSPRGGAPARAGQDLRLPSERPRPHRLVGLEEGEGVAGGVAGARRVDGGAAREVPAGLRPRRAGAARRGAPRRHPTRPRRGWTVIEKSVRALGVTQARWVHDYFRTRPRLTPEDLRPLVEAGRLLEVRVRGWETPGFVHRDHAPLLRRAAAGKLVATHTALLSPFDPVVWDRERALAMFGFDYRLECYVPARKRRHGYFVLPVLRRGALVGRLDAKAHRARGVFEVKALHLEPGRGRRAGAARRPRRRAPSRAPAGTARPRCGWGGGWPRRSRRRSGRGSRRRSAPCMDKKSITPRMSGVVSGMGLRSSRPAVVAPWPHPGGSSPSRKEKHMATVSRSPARLRRSRRQPSSRPLPTPARGSTPPSTGPT